MSKKPIVGLKSLIPGASPSVPFGAQPAPQDHRPLFIATTAAFAGIRIGISVAVQLIDTLKLTGVINGAAADALNAAIRDEAYRAISEAPELKPVLDAYFGIAR